MLASRTTAVKLCGYKYHRSNIHKKFAITYYHTLCLEYTPAGQWLGHKVHSSSAHKVCQLPEAMLRAEWRQVRELYRQLEVLLMKMDELV